ncbi:hypothetical protein DFQ26_001778 [Actinomortierella ambigua]|nr:hypothetical protein DFQ26_001778 [Actinomortierella ambigua]
MSNGRQQTSQGSVIPKNSRETSLKIYNKLLEKYPAISYPRTMAYSTEMTATTPKAWRFPFQALPSSSMVKTWQQFRDTWLTPPGSMTHSHMSLSSVEQPTSTSVSVFSTSSTLRGSQQPTSQDERSDTGWNGQGFLPQKTVLDVYTDASEDAWDIVVDGKETSKETFKEWTPQVQAPTPYQLGGAAGHLAPGSNAFHDEGGNPCDLRQHDNHRTPQPVWWDSIPTAAGPSNGDLRALHCKRNSRQHTSLHNSIQQMHHRGEGQHGSNGR